MLKKTPKFHLKFSALTLALLASTQMSYAYETPAASVSGAVGDYASGTIDLMQPFMMNPQRLYYVDAQLQSANSNSGIASLGLGARYKYQDKSILGGYLFVDRERSSSEAYYTVLGPGVEMLSPTWRFRLNGYFPVGDTKHLVDEGWADEFGIYDYVNPHDNQVDDVWAYRYESLSYGGDFSASYRFANDPRWELELKPYGYDRDEESTIVGAKAQVNFYKMDNVELFIGDGYDNANHNEVYAGVTLSFGSRTTKNDLDHLMLSEVARHQNLNTRSDGIASDEYYEFGAEGVEDDDVVFVEIGDEGSESGSGTAEDPYTSLDSIDSNDDPDASFRIEGDATYTSTDDSITLVGNQSVGGYTNGFTTPATGSSQPVLVTELNIEGDNTVSNVKVEGKDEADTGVVVQDGASLTAENITVEGVAVGIEIGENAEATINSSEIDVAGVVSEEGSDEFFGVGIEVGAGSTVTLNESLVNNEAGANENTNQASVGIYLSGEGAEVDLNDSTVNVDADTDNLTRLYGIYSTSGSEINLNDSSVNINGNQFSAGIYAVDMWGDDSQINVTLEGSEVSVNGADSTQGIIISAQSGQVDIENSEVSVVDSNDSYSYSTGMTISGNVDTIVNDSEISTSTSSDSSVAVGITNYGNGDISITNSTIEASAQGNAEGVFSSSGDGDISVSDSTIIANSETGNAVGIIVNNDGYGENSGDITVANTTFQINSAGNAYGIYYYNVNPDSGEEGAITSTGNTFNVSGGEDSGEIEIVNA